MSKSRRLGRRLVVFAATLLLTFAVASCTDRGGSAGLSHETAASTSTKGLTGVSDENADADADADHPAAKERTVSGAGISFAVPAGWEVLDPDDVADAQDPGGVLTELGGRLGMSEQQARDFIRHIDLFVFTGDGAKKGFLDNINVIGSPGAPLPTDGRLRMELLRLGADGAALDHVETAAGDAVVATYSLQVNPAVLAHGRGIVVATDRGTVTVTVSSATAAKAEALADRILATVARP